MLSQSHPANGCGAVNAGAEPPLTLLVPGLCRLVRAHNSAALADSTSADCVWIGWSGVYCQLQPVPDVRADVRCDLLVDLGWFVNDTAARAALHFS